MHYNRLKSYAESNGLLYNGQYGSRENTVCQLSMQLWGGAAILRVIFIELCRRVRVNDCQNPEFTILDFQNLGFPKS